MKKLKFAVLALAAGLLAQGGIAGTANAMPAAKAAQAGAHHTGGSGLIQVRRGDHHGFRHGGMRRHHFGGHHGFRRHHWRPRVYFYNGYSGGGGCYWLKRRAMYTGSGYWWRRYNACRYGW